MPLDPDLAALLDATPPVPLTPEVIPQVRAWMRALGDTFPRPDGVATQDFHAGDVPVRLYRPDNALSNRLLVFIHGGGWFQGDLDTHDAMCAWVSKKSGYALLAVGYRLAPEHRFPAGLDDCDAAFSWAVSHARELGCDPASIALGGESAGANLAAAVVLRRAARNEPQPLFQCLIYPPTDMRLTSPLIREAKWPDITLESAQFMCAQYGLGTADIANPDVSPVLAESHRSLAPAIVLTAEYDSLRDDGEAYALKLAAAGVETLVQRLPGLPHGFLFFNHDIPAISNAFSVVGKILRRYAGL
ncbi:alpha/beta hydrolase [Paraburkholderia megapolitana]|uniref:alpha/beta hydrolase n=1 Tax=Paraburkholderia megapolitana TaxID=420953 RepID=UPI0038B6EB5B